VSGDLQVIYRDKQYSVRYKALRIVSEQARFVSRGLFVILGITFVGLSDVVPVWVTAAWALPLMAAMALRTVMAKRVLTELAEQEVAPLRLKVWLQRMRYSSMANQALAGSSVWFTGSAGDSGAALFITVLAALFAVGALTNLLPDGKAVMLSVPLLMGQLIAYWASEGTRGASIALSLALVLLLMIRFAQTHGRTFMSSERLRARNAVMATRARMARIEAERMRAEEEHLRREAERMRAEEEHLRREAERMRADQSRRLEQLDAARQAEKVAEQTKAKFLAAACHDLGQPLYAIRLHADTLLQFDLPPEANEAVGLQQRAIDSLSGLFASLMDLSRFESGKIEPQWGNIRIEHVFDQLEAEFKPQCVKRGIALRVVRPQCGIVTDRFLLVRLLGNLLSNAVRYTLEGTIELGAVMVGERVKLWVSDTGVGIAPEDQERVFEEFVQLPNVARKSDRGIGLGLSIARHVANLLGSNLSLHSELGKGTCFTLYVRCAEGLNTGDWNPERTTGADSRDSISVWIVEDDQLVLEALAGYMKRLGVRHHMISSAPDFRRLRETAELPDAVIFDDMLGGDESGLDLAIELSRSRPDIRILIATANTRAERLQLIDSSGFSRLQKPLGSKELRDWLKLPEASTSVVSADSN
jgi:signal transduction histidine kinase/CheY-like chemotaxis protein